MGGKQSYSKMVALNVKFHVLPSILPWSIFILDVKLFHTLSCFRILLGKRDNSLACYCCKLKSHSHLKL